MDAVERYNQLFGDTTIYDCLKVRFRKAESRNETSNYYLFNNSEERMFPFTWLFFEYTDIKSVSDTCLQYVSELESSDGPISFKRLIELKDIVLKSILYSKKINVYTIEGLKLNALEAVLSNRIDEIKVVSEGAGLILSDKTIIECVKDYYKLPEGEKLNPKTDCFKTKVGLDLPVRETCRDCHKTCIEKYRMGQLSVNSK